MVSLAAAAGLTLKTLLTVEPRPAALAVNCLFPAASISRLLKPARPFPAAVPMSSVVVPWSGPVPEARPMVTFRLAGNPKLELFPNASWLRRTGWVPNGAPAIALPGWPAKLRVVAGAGLIAIAVDVAVSVELVNRIVMFVATLCERLVKVTMPAAAVRFVAPCKAPLPALRLALTTVALSLVRRFAN